MSMTSKVGGWMAVGVMVCGGLLAAQTSVPITPIVQNRAPLPGNAFYILPLTSIEPEGWLRRQLEIQANGLTGHLDEFWPDLEANSGWLGGNGESWERGPYYLDGLLPLAYELHDPRLLAKAHRWVEWTLTHQRPDGAIGPVRNTDWWPNMVMLKVLTQYQEASGDPRVIPLMTRYFRYQAQRMAAQPLHEWAAYLWGDEVLSVLWLYNRTGESWLLDLARQLHDEGYDWKAQFADFKYPGKITKAQAGLPTHGVNNAMALKTFALWGLVSGDVSDRKAIYPMLAALDKNDLQPNGMDSADEHYAGSDPSQGVELCAVVEAMFSLEQLEANLGDPMLADRLERITYNALPATLSGDMWTHQYDQQPNQVMCSVAPRSWVSNGPDSNLFGLEPNFGCCTANMHQGWPKFVASLWMATPGGGLAAIAYGPNTVHSLVSGHVPISITEATEYPFRDTVELTLAPSRPAAFPLQLRIPGWAQNAQVLVNGRRVSGIAAGSYLRIARTWRKGDRVTLRFPMEIRTTRWYRHSAVVERGPLVYALKIGEEWRKLHAHGPTADWEVVPTSDWNYGLQLSAAGKVLDARIEEKKLSDCPFSRAGAPIELQLSGRLVPEWGLVGGSAGPLPQSPVMSHQPERTVTLIPYGAAKLRITAFPVIAAQ